MSNPKSSPPLPTLEFELELVKEKYFFLQSTIEDYNRQIWVIKALGITGTGAAIGLAFQLEKPLVVLLGAAIPLFFWILESQWKHFQRGFYPRVAEIEQILHNEFRLRSPAVYGDWCQSFNRSVLSKRNGYFWDGLLNPSVFISYLLEIISLLLMWTFVPFT